MDAQVRQVLVSADEGALPLVVLVTAVNGIAEELFFRGALYAAVTRHPVAITTFANALVVLAAGNLMLTLAAVLLAVVVGLERQASDGVLGPILTHVTWSGSVPFALPLLIGRLSPNAGRPAGRGAPPPRTARDSKAPAGGSSRR